MKYILFFLITVQTVFGGREFLNWNPSEKLHEFILRHYQIMTHLDGKLTTDQECAIWYQKFQELWIEVESTEFIFNEYFTNHVNVITNKQKKVYDEFRKLLAKNKAKSVTAQLIGEVVVEHLIGTSRQAQ